MRRDIFSEEHEMFRGQVRRFVENELVPKIVLGYGSEYFSSAGRRFLKVKPTTLEYGYPRRNAFRQPVLELILRDKLSRYVNATIWFETELLNWRNPRKP